MQKKRSRRIIFAGPGSGLWIRIINDVFQDVMEGRHVVIMDASGGAFEEFAKYIATGLQSKHSRRSEFIKVEPNSSFHLNDFNHLTVYDFYWALKYPGRLRSQCRKAVELIGVSSIDKLVVLEAPFLPVAEIIEPLWCNDLEIDVSAWSINYLAEFQLDAFAFTHVSQHLVAKECHMEALAASQWLPDGCEDEFWMAYHDGKYRRENRVATLTLDGTSVVRKSFTLTDIPSALYEAWHSNFVSAG